MGGEIWWQLSATDTGYSSRIGTDAIVHVCIKKLQFLILFFSTWQKEHMATHMKNPISMDIPTRQNKLLH